MPKIFTKEQDDELNGFVEEIKTILDKVESFVNREDVIKAIKEASGKTDSWDFNLDIPQALKMIIANSALMGGSRRDSNEEKVSKV
jgi:hypothetical protein